MRFDDMVLKNYDVSKDFGLPTALDQHEADMAAEVACPGCEGMGWRHEGQGTIGPCPLCTDQEKMTGAISDLDMVGTGRVTIYDVIKASRARKVKT